MSVMHIGSYGHNFICLNPNLSLLIEKNPSGLSENYWYYD